MLKQRILTAAILIPVVLGLLFYVPPQAFCVLAGLLVLGASYEWTRLMQLQRMASRLIYIALLAGAMYITLFNIPIPLVLMTAFAWWLLAALLVMVYPRGIIFWTRNKVVKGLMGIMVLLPCWVALSYIRNTEQGTIVLLYLFILIWGADSAAYFVGKKWGTTKLAPKVSPGKSVQGATGAILFAILITIGGAFSSDLTTGLLLYAVGLAVATVVFSILGDLFESMFKREAGLKDSGNILPGHGGLLDRIDSLTAAAPVYALGFMLRNAFFS